MKQQLLFLTGAAILALPVVAMADTSEQNIADKTAQKRAENILKTEPNAKEVHVSLDVETKVPDDARTVNFDQFDLNKDGILARDEVGEKLFEVFDLDGNEVIDNKEMKKPSVVVFVPAEKTTVEIIDYKQEEKPMKARVTQQEFLQQSKLSRFDKNADGLSPIDFLEIPFNTVNVKDDSVIDLEEWKRAYAKTVNPIHTKNYKYN